ncbi:MAG: ABC transporter ATP-binding protein, partial [Anaerolineae bacterium]|nr:ABC transporter ATP-binding protein [Anaerolineae bacterium]
MLHVVDVKCAFDSQPVLRGVTLDVQAGEVVCLLGPSGSGKTTLLRIVAGLERADGGDVRLNGDSISGVPVHERGFGLMFQDFALFPHMNVEQNVGYGLRMQQAGIDTVRRRVGEMLELVGLRGFEKRDVTSLSGGERQRVALARSLAPNPRLLMLDEPLGSLDAALRERLVVELRAIIKEVGLTAVYITHDQREAFAVADRLALLNAGRIEQIDAPEVIYRHPKTEFAARFLGLTNIIPIERRVGSHLTTPLGTFEADDQHEKPAKILIHPLGIQLGSAEDPQTITGALTECVFAGDRYRVEMRHASGVILAFTVSALDQRLPSIGGEIAVRIMPD